MAHLPEKYAEDKEIIRLTIEQIQKDFGSYLPEIMLSENASSIFDELKNQLEPVLKSLYKNNRNLFVAILYKIDVKMSDLSSENFAEMAEKIIQREFKKVLTKKYFSLHKKS
jgi:hypothetical protein